MSSQQTPSAEGAIARHGILKQGAVDPTTGIMVEYLVIDVGDYAVYLDPDWVVWWTRDDALNPDGYAEVAARIVEVENMPQAAALTSAQRWAFKLRLAAAMQRILGGEGRDRALAAIQAAESFAVDRSQEIARGWQLSTSLLVMLSAVLILVTCSQWSDSSDMSTVFLAAACGAVGAFFSIAARLGSLELAPSAGASQHALEAAMRIVVGIIASLVVYLAIRGKLLLDLDLPAAAGVGSPDWYKLLVYAVIGGASEYFIPNFINQLGNGGKESGSTDMRLNDPVATTPAGPGAQAAVTNSSAGKQQVPVPANTTAPASGGPVPGVTAESPEVSA